MSELELAVQDDAALLWHKSPLPAPDAAAKAVELGAGWVRFNVFSSALRANGWAPYLEAVTRAQQHGLRVQVTISGQPRWDLDKHDGGVKHEDPSPESFANFARYVVEVLAPRGVRRFSLWNEPNHPAFLASRRGSVAVLYGRLYRAAYTAVREVDNDCQILFGELSGRVGASSFLRAAVASNRTFASGIAVHPYQYERNPAHPQHVDSYEWGNLPRLAADLRVARARLQTRDGKALPVYVTEFGYFRKGSRSIPEGRRRAYMEAVIADARRWGLRELLYYHLVNAPADASWDTGIVSWAGINSSTFTAIKREFGGT